MWLEVKRVLDFKFPPTPVVDISGLWNNKKKYVLMNMVNAAILRIIWLTMNDMVFNRTQWFGMQVLWRKNAYTLAQWSIMLKEEERGRLMMMVKKLVFGSNATCVIVA
jgi:hypothetical protein